MGGEKVTFLVQFLGTVILLRTRHPPVYLSSFYNLQRGMIYENTVCIADCP